MKRLSLLLLALGLVTSAVFAGPVDVNTAKEFGQKYVRNTLGKKSADLSLAYTQTSEAGVNALYVFNYDQGFVVVAADDRAHPILGYTEGQPFDFEQAPDGLKYYLRYYARQIQYAIDNDLPMDMEIAEQWYLLEKEGVIMKTTSNRAVAPLLATTWDQGWPYNYYAPACTSYWTNNHCYAGCVACSMSQVMKFWNWPETGNGEHSYSTSTYGGTLSANFGATTYNWSIMPNSLGNSANEAALAVALLMYHCGVAVDMDFDPSGSGAHTEDVPTAVIEYFRYGACTNLQYRDDFSRTAWEDMLIASFDRGIPVVYSGTESDGSGGHAFNCDGYNNQRYFHFNWGWSGSFDNYYQIDALNTGNGHFNANQRVVFDMVPDYIYDAMVPPIESMVAEVSDAMTKTVNISFTVPEVSESGAALTSIERILLKRNGDVIQTYNNPQPGEVINYEDNLDEYGAYEYSILGVNNDMDGKELKRVLIVGPNCTWKLVCSTTNFQGWNKGKVQVVSANGTVFKEVTMEGSTPISEKFQMPEGDYSLQWFAPKSDIASMSISLKNSANQQVYNFSGSSTQLNGTIHSGNNDCQGCTPPTDLTAEYYYEAGQYGTRIAWSCDYSPSKFKIYRSEDGVEYEEIAAVDNTENEYIDLAAIGEYYYKVTAFSSACESTPAFTQDGADYVFVTVTSVGGQNENAVIFPNPANDRLVVRSNAINEVMVYDLLGQCVYRYQGSTEALEINTSAFNAGVYTVNVTTSEGKSSGRIVIIH
jgi:hypothetical protein